MPDSLHPPFVSSATTQPRQLIRWLDINPQGGALQRTQTFITLPVFSVNSVWLGYSQLIAAFNFEAPNNFTFHTLAGLISNPNYLLCVMWEDVNHLTHRYAIWRNVGEVIYFPLAIYTGQLIKKNFRLEVWSTNVVATLQNTTVNFYTSVLGTLDYRYGLDIPLSNSDPIVINFEEDLVTVTNPVPPNPPPVTDPAVTAFIACSSIVDATQITAITNLVASLKAAGLWTIMDCIYPFVGGNAGAHKCNLKSPGTFNLTFFGGITHDANGITGNGTTGYADTSFIPNIAGGNYSLNSASIGVYNKSFVQGYVMSSDDVSIFAALAVAAGSGIEAIGLNSSSVHINGEINQTGFVTISRTTSLVQTSYSKTLSADSSSVTTGLPSNSFNLLHDPKFNVFSAFNLAFAFIGAGLSPAQVSSLKTIVIAFETTLGRA